MALVSLYQALDLASDMSAFCDDQSCWSEYFCRLAEAPEPEQELLTLRLFEWSTGEIEARREIVLDSAAALIDRDTDVNINCPLRVVVLPYKVRHRPELAVFRSIFKHYAFTLSSVCERLTAVTHSFGTRSYRADRVEVAWSHFLCKSVAIEWKDTVPFIVDHYTSPSLHRKPGSWISADFHLHVRTRSDESKCVTLLLFGAPDPVIARFRSLLGHPSWRDVIEEPFLLFLIIWEQLYRIVDRNVRVTSIQPTT